MKQAYEEKGHVGRCNSHFTGNSCMKLEVVEEHIATNGPRRTKIVQYFPCQKFVEMAPKDRFQELKNNLQEPNKKRENTMMECVKEVLCESKSHMTSIP